MELHLLKLTLPLRPVQIHCVQIRAERFERTAAGVHDHHRRLLDLRFGRMLAALCVKNMLKSRLRLRQIGAFECVAERREVRGVRRCALGLHMPEKMDLLLIIEAILQCAVCLRKRVLQLAQRPAVFAHTEIQRLSQ